MSEGTQVPDPRPDRERQGPRSPYGGLCASCSHVRTIASERGSVFVLCGLSREDARFPRYPPQPVVRCTGFQR